MENKLSRNLKTLRRKYNFKQNELANKLNVSRQTISSWETGRNTSDIETLIKITALYGISLNQLISDKVDQTPQSNPINKNILGVLFIILLVERLTVNAPAAARIWIDFLICIPIMITVIVHIFECFRVMQKYLKVIYFVSLGLFALVAIFSSVSNLFSMGFAFQMVCFICGVIPMGWSLCNYIKLYRTNHPSWILDVLFK